MNKYIIPICIFNKSKIYDIIINARSFKECEEKLMNKLIDEFDLSETDTYEDFVKELDDNNILIGTIRDIEEL